MRSTIYVLLRARGTGCDAILQLVIIGNRIEATTAGSPTFAAGLTCRVSRLSLKASAVTGAP